MVDRGEISVAEATADLRRRVPGIPIKEKPKGESQFLFGPGVGKSRSLNIFYDSGCAECLMKDEVAHEQLTSEMTRRGPFYIGAAGGTRVRVNDEYLVLLPLMNGSMQVIQGLTVPQVTANFPYVGLK